MIDWADVDERAPAIWVEQRARCLRYGELKAAVQIARDAMVALPAPALAFAFCPNSPDLIVAYLACLDVRIPLGLGEPSRQVFERVIPTYRPTMVLLPMEADISTFGYTARSHPAFTETVMWIRQDGLPYEGKLHPQLALLLATSGSTGDAKFVRLTRTNLEANARSIAEYLRLTDGEIAAQSLPLNYSYGLSILNSHLIAGASVAMTRHSFIRPEFWQMVDDCACTSFSGVPYMYETLYRLRLLPTDRPSIRTLTQAGGALKVELLRHFNDAAHRQQAVFYAMYGQTEATARIAYVPPERLADKAGTIGIAIPRGELWLKPVTGESTMHEIHYRGPNVMMGYAQEPADLARGDELTGVLATGDLGEIDEDGYLRVTGRLARFVKLFGKRVNLAHIESEIERAFGVRCAALGKVDALKACLEAATPETCKQVRIHLARWLGVPPLVLEVVGVDRIPLTSSGKKNYKALQ